MWLKLRNQGAEGLTRNKGLKMLVKQMSTLYMDDVTAHVIIADKVITYVIIDDDISS